MLGCMSEWQTGREATTNSTYRRAGMRSNRHMLSRTPVRQWVLFRF